MGEKLVIWGASSHALVVADAVRLRGEYEVVGFLDDVSPGRGGEEFCGARVLGGAEQLGPLSAQGVEHLIVAIGTGAARVSAAAHARERGFRLATAVHPRATVAADVTVGAGTVVFAGAVINPGARIGENVIIETCACVEHECSIGDGAMVSSTVCLGGRVEVGASATVEIGAVVARAVRIGVGSVVGAGSVVLHDVPEGVLAYGVPARVVREIQDYHY